MKAIPVRHTFKTSSGAQRRYAAGRVSKPAIALLIVASIWTLLFVIVGAIAMLQLKRITLARAACIVAVLPALGPCFLLEIPFGA
jgi:predicted membrane channel-forming protein YqfA (hemolysin III family)